MFLDGHDVTLISEGKEYPLLWTTLMNYLGEKVCFASKGQIPIKFS